MKRRIAAVSLAVAAVSGLGLANAGSAAADDGCFRVGHWWVCPA
jgi:hypothetical protein